MIMDGGAATAKNAGKAQLANTTQKNTANLIAVRCRKKSGQISWQIVQAEIFCLLPGVHRVANEICFGQ